jgi:hypothetical protein
MYSFSKVCPLTNRGLVDNQAFIWKNSHGRPLAWALLSSSIRDMRTYMGRRFATYTSVFVFLLLSVAFACPNFYNFSSLIRPSSLKGKVMDHNPCRQMDDNAPQSPCYRALHDRLFPPATISGPLGDPGRSLAAVADSVLSSPVLPTQLPAWRSKSSPKLPLTVLFPVLRI